VPAYDYQCRSCGTITEVVHSMLEQGPTACAKCGGPLRLMIHPTGIIFRGSGFYKTDSRASKSADSATPSATPAATDGGSGTSGSTSDAGSGSSSGDKGKPASPASKPAGTSD
jgi:putative FmdB family regulatory protein